MQGTVFVLKPSKSQMKNYLSNPLLQLPLINKGGYINDILQIFLIF